jgi:hypothetical protein
MVDEVVTRTAAAMPAWAESRGVLVFIWWQVMDATWFWISSSMVVPVEQPTVQATAAKVGTLG